MQEIIWCPRRDSNSQLFFILSEAPIPIWQQGQNAGTTYRICTYDINRFADDPVRLLRQCGITWSSTTVSDRVLSGKSRMHHLNACESNWWPRLESNQLFPPCQRGFNYDWIQGWNRGTLYVRILTPSFHSCVSLHGSPSGQDDQHLLFG